MTPDISIIVPAYNVGRYIAATLRSALGQRTIGLELIVVDDGSTDTTAEGVAPFLDDPRVRVIRQENQGPSAARNAGLAAATGRYIGFLDGDDLWDADKAQRHVALMDQRPEVDLSYSWWRIIDGSGCATGRTNTTSAARIPGGLSFEGLIIENFTGTASTVVCRREALTRAAGFDPELRSCVDLDVWLRVALQRSRNIALVPEVLTSYRLHGSQITSDWRRMLRGWEVAIEKARQVAPDRVARVETTARARLGRYLAYIAYEQGDYAAARRLIGSAWSGAPGLMSRDRRCWVATGAILTATLLPAGWHDRLAASAKAWRARSVWPRVSEQGVGIAAGHPGTEG